MHLKTLTLKGFKSFASATTLRLEPGITCVVGPNGSGKSNVVDALAWVMGEQGAKTLRGGSMADVVFAGTSGPAGRSPLGRAEVSLTIDNGDGALPLGVAEVTITRTMFRTGGSEYSINGTPARLLDVQELLSDSGIGREMHVIVGQGQLDAVLHATPEERRGFVEEAAGVLKHRRRKERALRKLESMQANLLRLGDVAAEVRRQLGPLARQADVARRAQGVQARVREARGRLLADDLTRARADLDADVADSRAQQRQRTEVVAALTAARGRLALAEEAAATSGPQLAAAGEAVVALGQVLERLRGTTALAAERERTLAPVAAAPAGGRDPAELAASAARLREAERALAAQVEARRGALAGASAARARAEDDLADHERAVAVAARAVADRRERLARLAGQVAARRGRAEAARAEAERLSASLASARERALAAAAAHAALREGAGPSPVREAEGAEHAAALDALAAAEADLARARATERAAERDRAGAAARAEALQLGLQERRDGTGALLEHGGRLPGVLGPLAALLRVEPGAEDVVAAALGASADAVAVEDLDAAVDAMRLLRDGGTGSAELLVADAGHGCERSAVRRATDVPGDLAADLAALGIEGARPLALLVTAPAPVAGAVSRLLAGRVAVPGLAEARALVTAHPDLVAVTAAGDVLGADAARGGSGSATSRLHVQVALDEAAAALWEAGARAATARAGLAAAEVAATCARERRDAAVGALQAGDAAAATAARVLGEASGAARAADAEVARLEPVVARARATAAVEEERAVGAGAALEAATTPTSPGVALQAGGDAASGAELAQTARAARAAEVEARLALRTTEERLRAAGGRAEAAERTARAEAAAAERATAAAERAAVALAVAVAVRRGGEVALALADERLARARDLRAALQREGGEHADGVRRGRAEVDRLAAELARLTDSVHRDELVRAERAARLEGLRARARDELGTDPDVLVAELGPHRPVTDALLGPDHRADDRDRPYVRAEVEQALHRAERELGRLGRVNPLALEEYAALEERAAFLTAQLDDLRTTRGDLLDIVRQVDERVREVFAAAFADTASEFERVFARLFPGGEGRLVLTDPDDLLLSGIEVEARPAGKRVRRLSLLSGGERSLTAVALLVAIFRARPSPFYVLDEVEAALDDANLRRLLVVLEELRESSQLIVITHQARTMEVADALYGVTMRSDGVSAVVCQRLREPVGAGA